MIFSKLYLYAAIAIALAGGFFYVKHVLDERDKFRSEAIFEREQKEMAIKSIADQIEEAKRTQNVLEVYHEGEAKIQYVDRVVTKQVIEYRDRNPDRIQLSADFVRAYNDSTSELYSENSSLGTNDSTGDLAKIVNDADVLEVATNNNRSCVRTIARLRALQEWANP